MHHRFLVWSGVAIQSLLSHLSPAFLFQAGDANARHSLPGFGMLLLPTAPFLLLGFLRLFFFRQRRVSLFLLAWLVLAPLPAALTLPVPHALRSILLAPILAILTGFGIDLALGGINRRPMRLISEFVLASVFFAASFLSVASR